MAKSLLKDSNAHAFLQNTPSVISEDYACFISPEHTAAPTGYRQFSLRQPLQNGGNRYLKRFIDLSLSSIFILLLFPWVLPLFAILIKLDSKGPVFFLQRRNKLNGDVFTCIKFRSMNVNSDADVLPAGAVDSRVTKLGRFLREHHLDELPQLFNVWLGDMSLIGPRPHMLSDNQRFEIMVPHYHYRHCVKPGITGLAQVSGFVGPVTDIQNIQQRVARDIHYVSNWSIALDTKIACLTILKIISRKQEGQCLNKTD